MENPIQSKEYYSKYVDKKTPNSKTTTNLLKAFVVGGIICVIGQFILSFCIKLVENE